MSEVAMFRWLTPDFDDKLWRAVDREALTYL